MSTPEAVDPLVQLQADEEAARAAAAEPVAAEPTQDQAQDAEPEATLEPAQEHPWAARFKSPDDMWQSYQHAEQKIREQGEELGDHRQFRKQAEPIIQQLAQQQAQPQPQFGQQPQALPDGTPILTYEQMTELRDEDPAAYTDLMLRYQRHELETQFDQRLEQTLASRLAPLEKAHIDRGAQDILDRLNASLGDDVVQRNADLIRDKFDRDRKHYGDPEFGYERMRQAIRAAELDRLEQMQSGGEPARPIRDVHVEGGSGAQPQVAGGTRLSPEEQEIVDSLTWSRPVDEQGIPLPPG